MQDLKLVHLLTGNKYNQHYYKAVQLSQVEGLY